MGHEQRDMAGARPDRAGGASHRLDGGGGRRGSVGSGPARTGGCIIDTTIGANNGAHFYVEAVSEYIGRTYPEYDGDTDPNDGSFHRHPGMDRFTVHAHRPAAVVSPSKSLNPDTDPVT